MNQDAVPITLPTQYLSGIYLEFSNALLKRWHLFLFIYIFRQDLIFKVVTENPIKTGYALFSDINRQAAER